MNQEEKKDLDIKVANVLYSNGILQHLQASMIADVADAVQESEFDSMKPFKSFKTDINHKLAEEIVFEYLIRNNMVNTIQCIVSESNRSLCPKIQPSGKVQKELGIDANENYLSSLIQQYSENNDAIFTSYNNFLTDQINERISQLNGSSTPRHGSSTRTHHRSRSRDSRKQANTE